MAGSAKKGSEDMTLIELQQFHWASCIQAAADIVGGNMKLFGLDPGISPEVRGEGNLTAKDVANQVVSLAMQINFATRPLGDGQHDCTCEPPQS